MWARRLGLAGVLSFAVNCGPSIDDVVEPDGPQDECETFRKDVEVVWNRRARRGVQTRLGKIGVDYGEQVYAKVRTKMDQITRNWVMLNEQACRDFQKTGDTDTYQKKRSCFDARLMELRELVTRLEHSDARATKNASRALTETKSDISSCLYRAVFDGFEPDAKKRARRGSSDSAAAAKTGGAATEDGAAGTRTATGASEGARSSGIPEARQLVARARASRRLGDAAAASELARKARERAEVQGLPRLLAAALLEQGAAAEELGRYDQAETAYQRVLQRATEGHDTIAQAEALHGLGTVAMHAKRFEDALARHRKALVLREEVAKGTDVPESLRRSVGTSHKHLGRVHRARGDLERALREFRKALAIHERASDEAHPEVASIRHNIGVVLSDMKRYEEARKHFRAAMETDARLLGEDHPDYGQDIADLGVVLLKEGKTGEAKKKLRRALAIHRAAYGGPHRRIAADHLNLGLVHMAEKAYRKAQKRFEKALAVDKSLHRAKGHDNAVDRAQDHLYIARAAWARDGAGPTAREHARRVLELLEDEGPGVRLLQEHARAMLGDSNEDGDE